MLHEHYQALTISVHDFGGASHSRRDSGN